MHSDATLRTHLTNLLTARQAHCTFSDAVAAVPTALRGERPEELPYSLWELVEHIRRTQQDILSYCRDPAYEAPDWPMSYWPDTPEPPTETAWTESIAQTQDDLDALCELVRDDTIDLHDTVPSSDEHTYLREAMLAADHTSYHLGQIVAVRRLLHIWPPSADQE